MDGGSVFVQHLSLSRSHAPDTLAAEHINTSVGQPLLGDHVAIGVESREPVFVGLKLTWTCPFRVCLLAMPLFRPPVLVVRTAFFINGILHRAANVGVLSYAQYVFAVARDRQRCAVALLAFISFSHSNLFFFCSRHHATLRRLASFVPFFAHSISDTPPLLAPLARSLFLYCLPRQFLHGSLISWRKLWCAKAQKKVDITNLLKTENVGVMAGEKRRERAMATDYQAQRCRPARHIPAHNMHHPHDTKSEREKTREGSRGNGGTERKRERVTQT